MEEKIKIDKIASIVDLVFGILAALASIFLFIVSASISAIGKDIFSAFPINPVTDDEKVIKILFDAGGIFSTIFSGIIVILAFVVLICAIVMIVVYVILLSNQKKYKATGNEKLIKANLIIEVIINTIMTVVALVRTFATISIINGIFSIGFIILEVFIIKSLVNTKKKEGDIITPIEEI